MVGSLCPSPSRPGPVLPISNSLKAACRGGAGFWGYLLTPCLGLLWDTFPAVLWNVLLELS